MQSIAVTGPGGSLHDLYYEYDGYGNLNYQTTTIGAAVSTEGFFYDALHRLTQSSRSYPGGSKTVNYAYDPSGNLTLKDDYASSYTYSTTTRPNAVISITKVGGGSVNFSYDANGNLTSGDGKSLTYTAFNKPRTITAGGLTATFHYGADLARYRQEKTNGETTLYIDKLMEIVSVGASTDYRHYLGENAILTKIDSLSDPYPSVKFVLRDRLGSVVTLTDETGANPERRGYDPFGKPRDGDWAEKTPPTTGSAITDRGFTDHEHLDESKLIHMNGRAYDYQLGRFLSVDPFIQEPGNSQSLNPYTYGMNNPLAGRDPSGYVFVLIPVAIKAAGYGLALYGAYEAGHAVGDNAYQVATGGKSIGEAVKDGATDVAINAAISYSGTRILRAADKITPDSVKKKVREVVGNNADKNAGATDASSRGSVSNGAESAQSASGAKSESATDIGSAKSRSRGNVGDSNSSAEGGDVPINGLSSNAARREAMRQEGIPTSQQPVSQSGNASGKEYSYEVPAPGGGTQLKSVQQQTLDRSHPGQSHWEAGTVKTDPLTGEVRLNQHGRPKLTNDKSKVDYP